MDDRILKYKELLNTVKDEEFKKHLKLKIDAIENKKDILK